MTKKISLIVLLLVSGSLFLYQWLRTDQELTRLDGQIVSLHTDLQQIDKFRFRLADIAGEIIETDKAIESLQKRLPPEPQKDVFLGELYTLFREHQIDVILQSEETVNKDFYQETTMRFTFNGNMPETSQLNNIFGEIDRLVQWELIEQDQVLITRIYNSLLDSNVRGIKPCGKTGEESMNYWPFHTLVRDRKKRIEEQCSKRNRDEVVLVKIKQLKNRLGIKTVLEEIVFQLDGEIKSYKLNRGTK